jgi:hypothetical protein
MARRLLWGGRRHDSLPVGEGIREAGEGGRNWPVGEESIE